MGLRDYTIYDFIRRNAMLYPEQDGVVFGDYRLTYREFRIKCDQLANGLLRSGVRPEDRLGVVAHNCDEFMILFGAAAKIGAILLPVNWRFQQDEMEYVLNDCRPKFCFAGPDFRQSLTEIRGKVASIEGCFTIGGGSAHEGFYSFESLYQEEGGKEEPDIPVDSGFVIIHTAAVAGRPRGALLSQRNIISIGMEMMQSYGLGPRDCHLCILPLFHIAGISLSMATLQAGGKTLSSTGLIRSLP